MKLDNIHEKHAFRIAFGIIALILLFAGGAGAATTLTVNASGGADYTRIQDAINNASDGDTILVYSGTYYENVNVTKQLFLKGIDNGGGKPVVDSGRNDAITLSAGNSVLEGFDARSYIFNQGITVYSNNNVIKNNNVSNNQHGILLISSKNNILIGNNASNNFYFGIYLIESNNNTLSGNNANSNTGKPGNLPRGIDLYYFSNNNTLIGNDASYNYAGILLYYSSNNLVYNNIFFNNAYNVIIDSSINNWSITKQSGTNIIGGSFLGGNFWGNPSGTGFGQTCTDANGDGICDSPYVLDANNVDYLPLTMNAEIPPPPVPEMPTIVLMGLGVFSLLFVVKKKK